MPKAHVRKPTTCQLKLFGVAIRQRFNANEYSCQIFKDIVFSSHGLAHWFPISRIYAQLLSDTCKVVDD